MDWSKFNQANRIAKSLRANPKLGLAAVSAGLVAPTLLSSDDRGFVSSAAITTPLIAAAYMAAPKLTPILNQDIKQAKQYFLQAPERIQAKGPKTYSEIMQMQKEFSAGNIRRTVFNRSLSEFYVPKPRINTLSEQVLQLNNTFNALLEGKDGYFNNYRGVTEYLENAVHSEQMRHLPTDALISYKKRYRSGITNAPKIGMQGIQEVVQNAITTSNEGLIKGLNFKLSKIPSMVFEGGLISGVPMQGTKSRKFKQIAWDNAGKKTIRNLRSQRPEVYSEVANHIKNGTLKSSSIKIITSNEALNPIIGLQIEGKRIPIHQPGGIITGGKTWESSGTGGFISTYDEVLPSDVFGVRYFHTPKSLEDVKRTNIIRGSDKLTEWAMFNPNEYESISGTLWSTSLASARVVPARSIGWGKDGTKGYHELTAYEQETGIIHSMEKGLIKSGSTGMKDGVLSLPGATGALYGMQNPTDQDPYVRILGKEVTLTDLPDYNKYPEARPYALNDIVNEIGQGEKVPLVGVKLGGVSAQQRTFFANLPKSVKDLHSYELEALAFLQEKHGLDARQASGAWKQLSSILSDPANLKAARKLGTLGEGSKILERNLYGMSVGLKREFKVFSHNLGKDPISLIGKKLSHKQIFGFAYGETIAPPTKGADYYLSNFVSNSDGSFKIVMDERLPFSQGAKVDGTGIKRGLIGADLDPGTHDIKAYTGYYDEFGSPTSNPKLAQTSVVEGEKVTLPGVSEAERISSVLNVYAEHTNGIRISNKVKGFALFDSEIAKGDPINSLFDLAASSMRSLDEMGQQDLVQKYSGLLKNVGWSQGTDSATLLYDSVKYSAEKSAKKAVDFKEANKIVQQLFDEAGARIRKISITTPNLLNETGRNFAASKTKSFEEFLSVSEMPTNLGATDHALLNVPHQVAIHPDTLQHLKISGHLGAVKDLVDRVTYPDGDPSMTADFAEYLAGDQSKITKTLTVKEALGGRNASEIRLTSLEGREGSIFDLSNPLAAENFLLQLDNGKTVPYLGHDAVGGKSNKYDGVKYSATKHEKALLDLMQNGGEEVGYMKTLDPLVYGKKSYLRTPAIDPLGFAGRFQNRTSSLKYTDGTINPFEIGISRHTVDNLKDRELAEALLRGETGTALAIRYPVSYAPLVQIKLDNTLGRNEFGIDEGLTPFSRGDFDGDGIFLSPFKRGSVGEAEAFEATSSFNQQDSQQVKNYRRLQTQESEMFAELPRNIGPNSAKAKTLTERLTERVKAISNTSELMKKRMVSNTIGEFSNTESILLSALEHNDVITNLDHKDTLRQLFYNIYQSPISAAKGKIESDITFEGARSLNQNLQSSVNKDFGSFYKAIKDVFQFAPASAQEALETHKGVLEDFHSGINKDAIRVSQARTKLVTATTKVDYKASVIARNMVEYLPGAKPVTMSEATGARMASEGLGAINEALTSAKRIGKAFESTNAKAAIGIGIGIASVAGLMTTTLSSPRARSANNFRPEVTQNTSDNIPGEAVEGSYSSNPPRTRVSNNTPNVSKAYVVPVQQTSDIEVNMKSDDPSRATEAAKMVAKSAGGGQTIVTNNYKNSNLTSLRNKQKLRERLDES